MSRVFFKTVNKPLLARKFTAGSTASSKKVAVVFGAGDATGASCCRAFAKDGFDVIAVRRNKGAFSGTLERMSTKFKSEGIDNVYGYAIDARKEEQVIQLLDEVETKFGPISLAIHNIGPNVGQSVLEGTTQRYQKMFEIAATSSLIVGRERQLAQSMSRELGPKGLHIAHIIVDGIIETPFHASDASPVPRDVWYRRLPNDGIIDPENIAEAFLFLSKQKKNAWTFEMDLRPWDEQW
eukprot:g8712.t1